MREVQRVDTEQALYAAGPPVPGGSYQGLPYDYDRLPPQEYPNVDSYRPSPGITLFNY